MLDAVRWTDKELRKLIAQIQLLGQEVDGKHEVTFGTMFVETANVFEALSGTLLTAKKHGNADDVESNTHYFPRRGNI